MNDAVSERGGETTRLGSFEIVRKLARGGMAEIFLAQTRGPSGFEKLVVLKKILPKYAGKRRFVQLFLEEAKLAASLDHPNIAQVYDIGMVDGSYFFTMEYLHGQDVRSILHRTWRTGGRFSIEHAVQIARHIASALHFAHEKPHTDGTLLGIVHRDVSPSNIIVTYDGATKLLDFGVAKTVSSSVKTRTGTLKGKVAYMSPEQARGASLDRRSDIFSLGIVLWEMVTTQRLYRADNDLATLQLILTQPPKPPTTIQPDCPPELERIVMRALAEDPSTRYATAEQLVTDLDELAREHKLKQSPNALAAMMNQLFAEELAAWREARAAGIGLADHLHRASDTTTPVSESDFVELDIIHEGDEEGDDDEIDEIEDSEGGEDREGDGSEDEDDDDDDDDDDNVKTEYAATVIEPLPLLALDLAAPDEPDGPTLLPASRVVEDHTDSVAPVTGEHARPSTPGIDAFVTPNTLVLPVSGKQSAANALSRAPATGKHGAATPPPSMAATGKHGAATPPPSMAAIGKHGAVTPPPSTAAAGRHPRPSTPVTGTHATPKVPVTGTHAVVSAPVTGRHATPSAPMAAASPPSPAANAPLQAMPDLRSAASPPFVVPPWQSGQPAVASTEERAEKQIARSWAVVELPAFDPDAFERRRRLVLRVAAGLVGFIFLLAILAGRC